MGRKKKPKPDDEEQYARFKEIAEHTTDEDGEERFQETMKRILAKRPQTSERNVTD